MLSLSLLLTVSGLLAVVSPSALEEVLLAVGKRICDDSVLATENAGVGRTDEPVVVPGDV